MVFISNYSSPTYRKVGLEYNNELNVKYVYQKTTFFS